MPDATPANKSLFDTITINADNYTEGDVSPVYGGVPWWVWVSGVVALGLGLAVGLRKDPRR